MMVHTLCQTSLTQLITTLIYTKCLETNLLESEWELGTIDREKGTVIGAYNLNWKTTQNVKEDIEQGTGMQFALDNDANVAALGERWKGAGNEGDDVAFITLGTGVGGGLISMVSLSTVSLVPVVKLVT